MREKQERGKAGRAGKTARAERERRQGRARMARSTLLTPPLTFCECNHDYRFSLLLFFSAHSQLLIKMATGVVVGEAGWETAPAAAADTPGSDCWPCVISASIAAASCLQPTPEAQHAGGRHGGRSGDTAAEMKTWQRGKRQPACALFSENVK